MRQYADKSQARVEFVSGRRTIAWQLFPVCHPRVSKEVRLDNGRQIRGNPQRVADKVADKVTDMIADKAADKVADRVSGKSC